MNKEIKLAIEQGLARDYQKLFFDACVVICEVLLQSYSGYLEDGNGIFRTQYNIDANAVWFLKDYGYVEIIEGSWPKTKYISFKFTDKFYKIFNGC